MSLLLSGILCEFAYADEVLLWKDCAAEAKREHPDLMSAAEKISRAKADKEVTRSAYLPQLDLGASETTSNAASSTSTGANNRATTYLYEGTFQQLLFDGFKTSFDMSTDERNISASKYYYDVTSSNVRLRLRKAYANLLTAQEFVKVVREIEARRKQTLEMVRLRYESGREHVGSLKTSEADLAKAAYDVTEAVRNIYLYQRQLTKELGRRKFVPVEASGDLEVTDKARVFPNLENIAETTPLLKQYIAQKEAARFGVKSAYAQYYPQIFVDGSLANTGTTWPPEQNQYSIGTSLAFPLFDGGETYATVKKNKGALGQAIADERSAKDSVIFTLADTWTKLQNAVDNVEVQRKILEAAKERVRIATAEYSIGLMSYDNWIIIENNLVAAKKSYVAAQNAALIAEADWVQAKGGTLDYDKE